MQVQNACKEKEHALMQIRAVNVRFTAGLRYTVQYRRWTLCKAPYFTVLRKALKSLISLAGFSYLLLIPIWPYGMTYNNSYSDVS
jgi:hypothetical protein